MDLTADSEYQRLLGRISGEYTAGQIRAHQAVNAEITDTFPMARNSDVNLNSRSKLQNAREWNRHERVHCVCCSTKRIDRSPSWKSKPRTAAGWKN